MSKKNRNFRIRVTEEENNVVMKMREGIMPEESSNSNTKDYEEFNLSAWDKDGTIMDIDSYCEHHGLPREDITSYKLITHSKNPYYNTVFRETIEGIEDVDFKSVIDGVLESCGNPAKFKEIEHTDGEVTRLIYTDTHIAMSTDIEGTAMYATPWNKETIMETLGMMITETIRNREGSVLYIDDLGDFLDGWDGLTTRGGHSLPQNMTNPEAFAVALEFKIRLIDGLLPYFSNIICHNVCNDNHSGDFSSILNHAFSRVVESRYDENVSVVNFAAFIDHYMIGRHAMVLCHGKDKKSLKFGFKPTLDAKQIEKIDHYLKHNEKGSVFKEADFIEFDKGDSHQLLLDYSTAQDFDYFNIMALSPASEWVQSNFKKGIRGFMIQIINPEEENKKLIPILL